MEWQGHQSPCSRCLPVEVIISFVLIVSKQHCHHHSHPLSWFLTSSFLIIHIMLRYMFADAPSHLTECRITGPLLWSNTDVINNFSHTQLLLWDQLLIYALNGAAAVIKDKLCSESCFRNIAHFLQLSRKLCHITDAKFVTTQASFFWNQWGFS